MIATGGPIHYTAGCKYQLQADWFCRTSIVGQACRIEDPDDMCSPWVRLDSDGTLHIKEGYAWDGCSGPTWDDDSNMRGGLAHDALYQLMRAGKLSQDERPAADRLLHDLCRQDGMSAFRAWCYRTAVNKFAGYAAEPSKPDVRTAP